MGTFVRRQPVTTAGLWGWLFLATSAVQAGDFYNEPWELRFAVAMDRQSNYPTTLGRHASIAFPSGSSRNPAADDWQTNDDHRDSASLTLIEAPTQSGALIDAAIGAASFRSQSVPGTWSLAFARTITPDSTANFGFHNEIESNELFLGYSRSISETLSWGIQGRLLNADLMRESVMASLGGLPGRVRTSLTGVDVEVGLLGETESSLIWGFVAGLGLSKGHSDIYNMASIPLPAPPFSIPSGTLLSSADDDILGTTLRLGVGKKWLTGGVFADIHYASFATDLSGKASFGRLSIGVEHAINPTWTARAGATVDTIQEWSLGFGGSCRVGKGKAIDFGYQYNAAPEMKPEWGRVHLFSLSAAWAL